MKIKDLPHFRRPREKLLEQGPPALDDRELVALILRSGYKGKSVLHVCRSLMPGGTIHDLHGITYADCMRLKGVGPVGALSLLALVELCHRYQHEDSRMLINTTNDAITHFHHIRQLQKEHFIALYLNSRRELIGQETISIGTLDASVVYPRDVFAPALEKHAGFVIVGHNHPSGNVEPSHADVRMTQRLAQAGELLGIQVLDHIIVSATASLSMKESGQV